eukprot:MONOS_16455.1-p1 / transcript=MONOS_16455.1 / gene=MONOS_16455 / organism=Monocercomonoides_exilis_PA203 / gene_product=unspecified product / transcript_product=unspecified product / location=Mono_scaffold01755:112-1490(-) / protein_length=326 / sequence_SO=supercontig / SO=protein_coding / is_pseudo=false
MSVSQFSPIVGLTLSADSAVQHSGAQSQPGNLSQPNIFSSASIFSPSPSEGLAQELTPSADRKENDDVLDISQLICQEALQEARTVRIQGRFGFRAATAMSTDASTGILTERQELILKETRQEAKLERGFQRPVLPITRVQAPRSQEDSNSEEGGTRAVGAGDQGGVNNFRASSQGDRAEEADRRKNSIVYLGIEANRRREIDKQWSAGHVEKQAVQESSQPSAVQRRSVASQPTKDQEIQENIRRTNTNRSRYPDGAEGCEIQKQCISYSKEVRQLETDSRLSETECSGEENTLQVRWRKDSGTADKTEILRSIPRLGTSLLLNP